MEKIRPYAMSIAGFDPTAGAGLLADIKTFEQHKVYGLSINTANTIQTENSFHTIQWISISFILKNISILLESYPVRAIKIGIVPTLSYLKEIVFYIKKISPSCIIVWDTVLQSTTKFDFLSINNQADLRYLLKKIDLITPNYNEIKILNQVENDAEKIGFELSKHCAVLLKGGHNNTLKGTDYLYINNQQITLLPTVNYCYEKHGSGCVLSSAITANLALGHNIITACQISKNYIEKYLNSTNNLLGYHYVS